MADAEIQFFGHRQIYDNLILLDHDVTLVCQTMSLPSSGRRICAIRSHNLNKALTLTCHWVSAIRT